MSKKNKKRKDQNLDLSKNSAQKATTVGPVKKTEPIPKEQVIGESKQIKESTTEKPVATTKAKKALQNLRVVRLENSKLENTLNNLSSPLKNTLDPVTLTLDNIGMGTRGTNNSVMRIAGKTANRQGINDVIALSLEERMRAFVSNMPTGLYGKILQAKYNNYLEENLPILKQSATIFIDDVCNGAYRGSENDNVRRFRFYKEGGVEITDEKRIERMTNVLNPSDYEQIASERMSFNDIDWQSEYNSWKNGYSLIRVVPNKKIAKDLYIKYVLKSAKAQSGIKRRDMEIRTQYAAKEPSNKTAIRVINGMISQESKYPVNILGGVFENNPDVNMGNMKRLEYNNAVYSQHFMFSKEDSSIWYNEYETHELGRHAETFTEFLTRASESGVSPIFNNSIAQSNDEIYPGLYFTFEHCGYSTSSIKYISDKLGQIPQLMNQIGTESTYFAMSNMNLEHVAFEDIYNNRFEKFPNINTSFEASGLDVIDNPARVVEAINEKTGARKSVEKQVAANNINYGRIEKMFETITGESIEYLDNTRTIPILVGNRLLGAFYIEYSHQDVEHYMGLRQLMNSNMVGSSSTTAFGIKEEEQEETIGRLLFMDIIKPILERNIDTKFLKNNSDLLFTLQKLLKENEVSNTLVTSRNPDLNNGFNLSRIIFIPEDELIFKRNGKEALGESRFNLAMVPANAAILGNESYLAYLLVDSKGMSFVEIPQGLSEIQGEEGVNPIMDQINDMRITRSRLRDLTLNNYDLGHKLIYVQKPDGIQGVTLNTIDMPEPRLDDQRIQQWVQQATDIVGYNSALFNTIDGNVEFARNLYEMNEIKLLQILTCRSNKIRPSSELATKLLRLRDPSYSDITVEWIAPPINRSNTQRRSEAAKEILDLYESYSGVMESLYADNDDYALVNEEAKKLLLQRIAGDDQIIIDIINSILKQAKEKKNVAIATELEEKDEKKSKKDDEENDEEDENQEE